MKSRALARGKHRPLRRRTLSMILSISLLSATFVFVDQTSSVKPAKAATAPTGNPDMTFNTNVGSSVGYPIASITTDASGRTYVGTVGGGIRRYALDGTIDSAFNTAANAVLGATSTINALAIDGAGNVFAAIGATGIKGVTSAGASMTTFNAGAAVVGSGTSNATGVKAQTINAIAVVYTGTAAATKIIVGTSSAPYVRSLLIGGTLDTTYNTAVGSTTVTAPVYAMGLDSAGALIVGGDGPSYLRKFGSTGTPDTTFTTNVGSTITGSIHAIKFLSDGSIIAGGVGTNNLHKFSSAGVNDSSFAPGSSIFNGDIKAISVMPGNAIFVGGSFTNKVVQIDSSGAVQTDFNTNLGQSIDNTVSALGLVSPGLLKIGGSFTNNLFATQTNIGDTYCTDSGTASQIVPGFYGSTGASTIAANATGQMITGGEFTTVTPTATNEVKWGPANAATVIPGWAITGGGSATYSHWTNSAVVSGNTAVRTGDTLADSDPGRLYFGNSYLSGSGGWDGTWTNPTLGWTTKSLSLSAAATYGGTSGIGINQNLATIPGHVYRLQYFVGHENTYTKDGIAGLKVDGYQQLYFRVDTSSGSVGAGNGTRYTVDFTAREYSTNIAFVNWGHVSSGTEMVLDTVRSTECTAGPRNLPDETSGVIGASQTINLLTNAKGTDIPSGTSSWTASSVKLCDPTSTPAEVPNSCTKTTVIVPGVGTYSVNTSGVMLFVPLATFTGTPDPLPYMVTDSTNKIGASTYTPTVSATPLPTGAPNYCRTSGTPSQVGTSGIFAMSGVSPLDLATNNLVQNGDLSLVSSATTSLSSYLIGPSATVAGTFGYPTNWTVAGGGTSTSAAWVSNAASTGSTTFDPLSTSSNGRVWLTNGNSVAATGLTGLTFESSGLSAQSLSPVPATGFGAEPISISQSVPTSAGTIYRLQFYATHDLSPTGSGVGGVNIDGKQLYFSVIAGSQATTPGTRYTLDFLATSNRTTIKFQGWGISATNTVQTGIDSVAVNTCPNIPYPLPDATTGSQGSTQSINLLTNSTGVDTPTSGSTLDPTSVKLCDVSAATPEVAPNCTASTVTVAGVGTYSVDSAGVMTFKPVSSFVGTPTGLPYTVADSSGAKAATTYTPTVTAATYPAGIPAFCTTSGTPTQLVPNVFVVTSAAETNASSSSLIQNGDFATVGSLTSGSLISPGRPTYVQIPSWTASGGANIASNNAAWFNVSNAYSNDPGVTANLARAFLGDGTVTSIKNSANTTVTWNTANSTVFNSLGWTADTYTLTPSSGTAPNALAQTITTVPGSTYRLQFFAGHDTTSTLVNPGIAGLSLTGYQQLYFKLAPGTQAANPGTRYTIDFVATSTSTTVKIQNWGRASSTSTELVLDSVSLNSCGVGPKPVADTTSDVKGATQTINLLTNTSGADFAQDGTTLDPTSVRICAITDVAPNCTLTTLTVAGKGTYTVNNAGLMTFVPDANFVGTAPPITYSISDSNGVVGATTYTATVLPPPMTANPDTTTGAKGAVQTINLATNDVPSSGATTTLTSIKLCNVSATPAEVSPNCTVAEGTPVVVAGVGSYVVNTSGVMTFTPEANYVGTPPALPYIISDSVGSQAGSTYTPTVIGTPTATADAMTSNWDTNQVYSPAANDTAASGTTLSASTVRICVTGTAAASCTGTSLTIANQGTYNVVTSTGQVTFDPFPAFSGVATPIEYVVADALGQKVTSTITPTIIGKPTAVADTTSGPQGVAQSINVSTNDSAASGTTLTPSSVTLSCGAAIGCTLNGNGTVTITGQGTFSAAAADGTIVFTPLANFTGTATPVTYTISDARGQTATTTYTPMIVPAPVAAPDTSTNGQDINQSINVLSNDAHTGLPLDATSVKLCDPTTTPVQTSPNCTLTSLTISGEGTYTVNPTTGVVTFDPLASFIGSATPIHYQVSDAGSGANKQTTTSTITPTVVSGPAATADTTTAGKGIPQTIDLLANDSAAPPATINASLTRLCGPSDVAPNCTQTSLAISGVGTYALVNGVMTFTPVSTYVGTPTPVTYSITDSNGVTISSTYSPTVIGTPTASADTTSGPQAVAQSINVLTNDAAASGTSLVVSSVFLCANTPSLQTPPNCTATSVTIPGQGTYSAVAGDGTIVFTPLSTFTGTATPVTYVVSDALGQKATSTYTPTLNAAPIAVTDTSKNGQDVTQTINVLSNDAHPGAPLDVTSVKLCDPTTTPAQVSPNCTLTTLTIPNEGTYTVNSTTGVVTFDPLPTFTGTATPVAYQVSDTGVGSNKQTTSSTITPTVVPAPTARPDVTSGGQGTSQIINLLTNSAGSDSPSSVSGTTLIVGSVLLCDISETAPSCTKTSVTVPGVGTYSVNSSGVMTFTPEAGYTGTPAPLAYTVADNYGVKAQSTYTPTVVPGPTAAPDTTTGAKGALQSVNVLTNDSSSAPASLVANSVKLCDVTETAPNCSKTSVTVANVGTYTVSNTGVITFTPLSSYVGTPTALPYTVTDSNNVKATSTYTPTVIGTPTAIADTTSGPQGLAQSIIVATNDSAASGTTLVASSVVLACPALPLTPACTRNNDGSITMAGQGTYSALAADGTVVFTPLSNFTGTAKPVSYTVSDALGQTATTTYTPTIVPAPVAAADTSKNGQDVNQVINPLTNDAHTGAPLDPTSVKLCDPTTNPAQTAPNCTATTVTIPGQGTYTVDPVTGVVTFDPEPTFTGAATAITYQVSDTGIGSNKQTTSATITPTVVPAPTARPDATTGGAGQTQTVNLLTNTSGSDSASTTNGATLNVASVKLCDPTTNPAEVAPDCTKTSVTVPGVGRYSVNSSGVMSFIPEVGYTGTPTALPYTVADNYGVEASSTYTPTVVPAPTAVDDSQINAVDVNQIYTPIANDTSATGYAPLATSVKICVTSTATTSCSGTSVEIAGQGTYTVNTTTGVVTFDPFPTFVGVATPVKYVTTDSLGQKATATINPTVVAKPVAANDSSTDGQDINQTVNVLTNDGGALGYPLDASTLKLCATTPTAQTPPNCTATSVTISGQGTYTISAAGEITFDPRPTFTGTATPVKYQVADTFTTPQVVSALYTPTVVAAPTVAPNTSVNGQDVNQVISILGNDQAATGYALNPTSVKLCDPAANPVEVAPNCTLDTLTIPGEGTYTVNPTTGAVTFDPEPTFVGRATPVTYQVSDTLTDPQTRSATITPTVIAAPVAAPNTSINVQDANQTISPLANDTVANGYPLLPATVKICTTATVAASCNGTTLTIPDEGTYTVNPTTGVVTFDPLPNFTGTATPIQYVASDSLGQDVTSTITPTVVPKPVAVNDTSINRQDVNQTVVVIDNDTAASAYPLNPASIKLCTTSPAQTPPNCTATSVPIAGQGTYTVDAVTGSITFDPFPTFTGTATAVKYQIADTYTTPQVASATYTPTVVPDASATNNAQTGPWDTNQTIPVLTNDTAPNGYPFDVTSVKLCAPSGSTVPLRLHIRWITVSNTEVPPNCSATSLTIPGEGTYTVNPSTGVVTFDPLPTFAGTVQTPVRYQVTDTFTSPMTVSALITPTVTRPAAPVAKPDVQTLLPGASIDFKTITDSAPTGTDLASGTQLQTTGASATCLLTPGTTVCDADGVVTIAGQGTFTLDPATGIVTYTADAHATPGTKTSVSYRVTDAVGQTAVSTLTPIIPVGPAASPDYSQGEQGATQFISPLGNDRPGASAANLDPASVFLCASNEVAPNCTATTVTVPGEGVYSVSNFGTVMFVPEPDFTGTATPIDYQVADNLGQVASSTIHVIVIPPPLPTAKPDTGSASFNHSVTLQPWVNDTPGTRPSGATEPEPNIVPSSIRLCDVGMASPHCTATRVTTDDGTYVLDPKTGIVVFTPVDGFIGTVTSPVTYQISNDWTGASGVGTSTSLLIPTITPPGAPAATVDITTTKPGTSVVINPVSNDKPGSAQLDPTTIRLCGATELAPTCTQTSVTNADGTYTLDTATGLVTFMPAQGFTGKASIPYRIMDVRGMVTNSNIIITVKDTVVPPVKKPVKKPAKHHPLAKTGYSGPAPLVMFVIALLGHCLVSPRRRMK